jgi:hypothetical protein
VEVPVFLEQHVIWSLFCQNRHEEFLHVLVHYACCSKFGKDWLSLGASSFTDEANLITIYTTYESTFLLVIPFQTLWNLLCTVSTDLDSGNHRTHLAFSTWDAIFTTMSLVLQVERFRNWSVMNYKLDHIISSDPFSFHTYAFQVMSSAAVKWYTFHLYILYLFYV